MTPTSAALLFAQMNGEVVTMPTRLEIGGVTIDSRAVKPGDLFFAIKGERVDGLDFAVDAWERGAAGVVVQDDQFNAHPARQAVMDYISGKPIALFIADDVRRALGEAARAYLAQFSPVKVAITGSSGKTTTRRIAAALLGAAKRVRATSGNYNNDLGVPLTVFSLERGDEVLVCEMGMNHPGELKWLAEIVRPDVAVVTNVGDAHLEFFGGDRARVAAAKKEVFHGMGPNGTAILPRADAFHDFLAAGQPGRVCPFGRETLAPVEVLEDLGLGGWTLGLGAARVRFALPGTHNLHNLAAALAVARALDVPDEASFGALGSLAGEEGRSHVVERGAWRVIDDSYNANPDSMRASLALLARGGGQRIAVLGDMFELGTGAAALHAELGTWLAAQRVCDVLVAVGPLMEGCARAAVAGGLPAGSVATCADAAEAARRVKALAQAGDTILVKASRGMHLEGVVADLE